MDNMSREGTGGAETGLTNGPACKAFAGVSISKDCRYCERTNARLIFVAVDLGPTACTGARAAKRAVRVCALGRSSHYATRRSRSRAIAMATLWTGRDMPPLVLQWFCSTCVRMVDVVASASSTHARAPCLGQAVPHARLQHACWVRSPHSSRGVMCCRGPRTG